MTEVCDEVVVTIPTLHMLSNISSDFVSDKCYRYHSGNIYFAKDGNKFIIHAQNTMCNFKPLYCFHRNMNMFVIAILEANIKSIIYVFHFDIVSKYISGMFIDYGYKIDKCYQGTGNNDHIIYIETNNKIFEYDTLCDDLDVTHTGILSSVYNIFY